MTVTVCDKAGYAQAVLHDTCTTLLGIRHLFDYADTETFALLFRMNHQAEQIAAVLQRNFEACSPDTPPSGLSGTAPAVTAPSVAGATQPT